VNSKSGRKINTGPLTKLQTIFVFVSVPLIKAEKFKNIVPSFNFDKEGVLMHGANIVLAFLCEFISAINPDRTSSNAFSAILKKAEIGMVWKY
jgi:hypothetical protein